MFPTKVLSGDVVTENGQKSSSEPKRRKFMNWIKDILRKANRNAFEISKDGKIILTVPVLVFVIVLLFAFYCRGDGPFATAIAHCHVIEPMGDGRGKRIVPTAITYTAFQLSINHIADYVLSIIDEDLDQILFQIDFQAALLSYIRTLTYTM